MPLLSLLTAAALVQANVPQVPPEPAPATADEEVVDPGQADAQPATPAPEPVIVQQAPAAPPMLVRTINPPLSSDRRIRLLPYDPEQVVTLSVSPGFASVVELAEDERVENLVVGNSGAWQVTANKRGDRVIVKPLPGAAQTNMVVLTATRRYVFVLDPFGETSFVMRFSYPQPVQAAVAVAPEVTYRLRGDKVLFPLAMYDDGRRTVIRWSAQHPLPAVFAMNGTQERLINGRMVGDDYIIEGASPRYRFRYGGADATAIRQTPKRRR
jgi:type IV secretion system protein VirB9